VNKHADHLLPIVQHERLVEGEHSPSLAGQQRQHSNRVECVLVEGEGNAGCTRGPFAAMKQIWKSVVLCGSTQM
jgi:hypothetical protein